MATIRKRGSRWEAQVRIKGYPSFTKTFTSHADAVAWAKEKERGIERAEVPVSARDLKGLTIGDLLNRYEQEIVPSKRGGDRERFKLRVIRRHAIARTDLSKLTGLIVAQYRDDRLKIVATGTVRRELAIRRHCLEVARKEWAIPLPFNPVSAIRLPAPGNARDKRLTPDVVTSFWNAVDRARAWYVKPLIVLAIETGMRRGELLSLTWNNVNLAKRLAYPPLTKNGTSRTVPLTPKAVETLAGIKRRDSEKVFPVSAYAVRQAWHRLSGRAGIDDLRFHNLRHEAISRFFEAGLSIPEVALVSGHRDTRMLFRYTHLRPEAVAEKLATMDIAS